jgi:hypothetical protein
MPVGDRDHIGCFADQVKLTRALVRDLDEAVKEVNLLEEHEEESSQKIIELEVVCKKLREDELILENAEEYGLNCMGENDDDDDEWNAVAP